MIIDADTHIMPQDALDYIEDERLDALRPRVWFNADGVYERMEFPGELRVAGTSPTPPPGSVTPTGAHRYDRSRYKHSSKPMVAQPRGTPLH